MPIEGAEAVVDPNAGGTPNNDGGNKDAGNKEIPADQVVEPKRAAGTPPDNGEYEKRVKGLTADLQKERKARQAYEADLKAARAETEAERKRIQALVGVTPKSSQDQEAEEIRARFKVVFPDLADLTKDDIAAIRELKARKGDLDSTTQHYWQQHASKMVDSVQSEIAKEIGGKLTDRQKQQIERNYALTVEGDEALLERHAKGDQTLVAEIAKQWIEDWFEPARRKVTQQEVQRFRAVPSGKDRGIVTHGEKKIDVTNDKQVEDMLVKGFRERNGEFGRR